MPTLSTEDMQSVQDFQNLVDDIESLMASPTAVAIDAVRELFERYSQGVKLVNARLRASADLLKKGLRNEALALSEVEPKLLELFLLIDFPERDSWQETLRQCGLTPPELLIGIATDLTDAATAEKPLADLKYQARLHALARSPLPLRMKLMRRLAKLDTSNPLWEADLKTFEKVRHNQLSNELQAAIKTEDLDRLTLLYEELQSADWITPPPKALQKLAADKFAILIRHEAVEKLIALEPELTAAHAAFDVVRGRRCRAEWNEWVEVAALSPDADVGLAAQPALQWLWEQDQIEADQARYDCAVAELNQALVSGADAVTLDRKHHELLALDRGVPDDLQARTERRLRDIKAAAARSLWLKLSLVAAALVAAASIGAYALFASSHSRTVAANVGILKQLLAEKQLDAAQQHLADLQRTSPRVFTEGAIQQLRVDLQTAQARDSERKTELQELLATARRLGVDQATQDSISPATEALKAAWDKSRLPEERTAVKELAAAVEERQRQLQADVEERFRQDLAAIDAEFGALREAPVEHLAELEQLKKRLEELLLRKSIPEAMRSVRARPLHEELLASVKTGGRLQGEAKILADMTNALGNRAKYLELLQRFVSSQEFVGTSRHREFQQVLREDARLWDGYDKWRAFFDKDADAFRDLSNVQSERAKRLHDAATKLLKDHPGFSFAPAVEQMAAFLGKIPIRERGAEKLESLLERQVFKVNAARSGDKQFYLKGEPPKEDPTNQTQLTYFTNVELTTTRSGRHLILKSTDGYQSGQMRFAHEAEKMLKDLRSSRGANWDATFIELLHSLHSNIDIDPILKIQLITQVIKEAGEGSDFLAQRLSTVQGEIQRAKLNPSPNWVDPEDKSAVDDRLKAVKVLDKLVDLKNAKPLLAAAQEAWTAAIHPRFEVRFHWIGWLRKTANSWTSELGKGVGASAESIDLFVLDKDAAGDVRFVKVGSVAQGRSNIPAGAAALVEGRPVFEKQPN